MLKIIAVALPSLIWWLVYSNQIPTHSYTIMGDECRSKIQGAWEFYYGYYKNVIELLPEMLKAKPTFEPLGVNQARIKREVIATKPGLTNHQISAVHLAEKSLGTPYQYGGNGPNKLDCSGLILQVFHKKKLDRTAQNQYRRNPKIVNPLPGDCVYFSSRPGSKRINHVGVITDLKGNFIHASSAKGMVIRGNYKLGRAFKYRVAGFRRFWD